VPRHLPAVVLLLALTAAATSQARQRPGRDVAPPRRPAGTASLAGHVLSVETGRPVARARVSISLQLPNSRDGAAPQGGAAFATLTDHAGAFIITDLPAGEYTLTAAKTSYLSMAYGARQPQRPGKRIPVKQGQQVRDIDVRLSRGSVLTGRVFDEAGDPIVRANVQAMRYQYLQGEPRLVGGGSAQTDDRGQFRIYGLVPGNYALTATARMEPIPDDQRGSDPAVAQTYAPSYYPGVTNPAEAAPIALGVQQEFANADFMLQTVPTARVIGTVIGEANAVSGAVLMLVTDDPRGVAAGATYSSRVQEDGTFTVGGVPPGRYLAIVRSTMGLRRGGMGPGPEARTAQVGIQPVSVSGQDVTGVTVALSNGGTIAGWVTFESANNMRADLNQLRLSTIPPAALPFIGSETARLQPDGTFTIANVAAGSHLLRLNNPPKGWVLKGIFLNGRDVSDQPIDVRVGQTTGGLQVVLTDRVTSVTGIVADSASQPVADCYVVLFGTDVGAWRPRSRLVQGTRPDEDGTYRFTGVPPGDYYLAVVGDIEPGSWYDPLLLGEWSKTAARVSVEEGDAKTVGLKYGTNE
jgi:protocatechuate 3,4-dioxygenase beta subunit